MLEVEKTADGKVEGEEELYPHLTVTWDPPRRLVDSVDDASSLIFLQIFHAFFSHPIDVFYPLFVKEGLVKALYAWVMLTAGMV